MYFEYFVHRCHRMKMNEINNTHSNKQKLIRMCGEQVKSLGWFGWWFWKMSCLVVWFVSSTNPFTYNITIRYSLWLFCEIQRCSWIFVSIFGCSKWGDTKDEKEDRRNVFIKRHWFRLSPAHWTHDSYRLSFNCIISEWNAQIKFERKEWKKTKKHSQIKFPLFFSLDIQVECHFLNSCYFYGNVFWGRCSWASLV